MAKQSDSELMGIALEQLNLVLSFFPRVDSMIVVVLGIDLAMLGVLASHVPTVTKLSPWAALTSIPVVLIACSLFRLYKAAYPRLDGGAQSLVYFREIAGRTEANFVHQFLNQNSGEYTRDLLGQVWRNSQILLQKYASLKSAFFWLAWAVFPWVAAITGLELLASSEPPA